VRLFAEPLQFAEGKLVLTPGFRPAIDPDVLKANEIACEQFATTKFQERPSYRNPTTSQC
jgi:hypothetical protein